MNRIHKYKIYSKGLLRRLARSEADSYFFSKRLLQARQTSPCSSASSMIIKCNEEIIDNVNHISSNQDNLGDDVLQSNSIKCDVLLPESIETISTDDDNNFDFDINNKSLNKNFKKSVVTWATKYGITHSALTPLLEILNTYTNTTFPKNPRTLLQTPRNSNVIEMGDGEYCHFNIKSIIKK